MGISTLRATTALAAFCLSSPAFAVTPTEVWQSWQDMATSYGQTLTSESVDDSGDVVTVTGLTLMQDQDGVKSEMVMSELVFTDNGDGTVDVAMPGVIPLTVTMPPAEGETSPTTVTVSISQTDPVMTAKGEAGAVGYDFATAETAITLDRIEGVKAEALDLVVAATLADLAGSYSVTGAAPDTMMGYEVTAASLNMTVSGKDPDPSPAPDGTATGPSDLNLAISMADLSMMGEGAPLTAAMMENLPAALANGVYSVAAVDAGATTMVFDLTEAGKASHMEMTGASTGFSFGLGSDGFGYGADAKDVKMMLKGADIPFPQIDVAYAEAAFDLQVPVVKGDAPQDFTLLSKLVDFTISEEIWAMFDPTGQLPRDPATLVIDTKGTATVTGDIMDPAAMEAMQTPPAEVNSFDITELHAKLAGADLTGAGSFTFDNTDLVTFGGFPAPTGKLDLKLVGGNGLLDKLVAMGLFAEDEAMGFRMMLSMFANTAPDKDEMTSTLEFKDKGFFANGQRLQ